MKNMSNREFNFCAVYTECAAVKFSAFFNSISQNCSINFGLFLSFLRDTASVSTWQICNPDSLQNVTVVSVWTKTQVLIAVLKRIKNYMAHCAGEHNWFLWNSCQMYICFKYFKRLHEEQVPYIFRKKYTKHDFEKK